MRSFGLVLVTAIVTALITSAVWVFLYNSGGRSAAPNAAGPAPSGAQQPAGATYESVPFTPRGEQTVYMPPTVEPDLLSRALTIPVVGVRAEALTPQFDEDRGGHKHEALDMMAPKGTPVVAVEDGRIAKLFVSKPGGNTIYEFDPTRTYAYYYAHLERYAAGLSEGDAVKRGQVIGYVGSSGNADPAAPHLHFAIFRLGPERHWWEGEAVDPYPVLTANVGD